MAQKRKNSQLAQGVFDSGIWEDCRLESIKRKFNITFPLSRFAFIRHIRAPHETYDNKLELAIRLASTEEYLDETQGGRPRRLRYPNVVVKIPGIPHTQAINEPRDAIFFAYDPSLVTAFKKAGLLAAPWAWECQLTPDILNPLRQMQELIADFQKPGVADQLDLLAMLVWQRLMQQQAEQIHSDVVSAQLRRIVTHLRMHFLEPVHLELLADENGFSKRSFFRHWKNHYSVSPAQFVLNLRLAEACHMLCDGDLKIGRISEALHFEHTEYFSRIFRKKYGMTPREYRQKHRRSLI